MSILNPQSLKHFILKYGVIATFILLYLWRPFVLGFYEDDWSTLAATHNYFGGAPFSWERFQYTVLSLSYNRPMGGIIYYITTSLFGNTPFLYHLLLSTLVLFNATLLYKILKRIGTILSINYANILSVISVIFWLVAPWDMAIRVWPTCMTFLFSLLFFQFSINYLISTPIQKYNSGLLLILFILPNLIYEVFLMQLIALSGIIVIILKKNAVIQRNVIKPIIIYLISQISAFTFSYLMNFTRPGRIPVPTGSNFISQFESNFSNYLTNMDNVLFEFGWIPEIIVFLVLSLLIIGLFKKRPRKLFQTLIPIFFSIAGVFIMYSLANYRIATLSIDSRTSMMIVYWFIYLFFFVTNFLLSFKAYIKPLIFILICTMMLLIGSNFTRINEWINAWDMEKAIINQLPLEQVSKTTDNSLIIFLGPTVTGQFGNEVIFLSDWGLTHALKNSYEKEINNRVFLPQWPGELIEISKEGVQLNGTITDRFNNRDVYIWKYSEGKILKIEINTKIFFDFEKMDYNIQIL